MIAERIDCAEAGALTVAPEDPRAPDSIALFDEMSAFVLATYPEDEENGIVPTSSEDLAREGVLLVARVGGVAAGTGALMSHPPVDGLKVVEVKRMLVRPAFRGRGLAERILAGLEDIAAQRGLQKLVLMCGPRQPAALKLYDKAGYSLRGPYGKWQAHPLSIFMEKHLETGS